MEYDFHDPVGAEARCGSDDGRSYLDHARTADPAQLGTILRPHGLTFARHEALVLLSFSHRRAPPVGTFDLLRGLRVTAGDFTPDVQFPAHDEDPGIAGGNVSTE